MSGSPQTVTQQQQTSQSYTPNALTAQMAQAVPGAISGLPGPGAVPGLQIAGLTPGQEAASGALTGYGLGAGASLIPGGMNYLGGGAGMIGSAGSPISGEDVAGFYNPMAANVTAQLQNIFGPQMAQTRANAVQAAGGVGAERAAIAPAMLANQQGLAAGQTYAGLYQQALQAAQQQKQQQLSAGMGLAGLGLPTLQAGFGGLGQALAGAGIPQQQQQNILNALYQQQQGQYQNPYQNLAAQLQGLQGVGGVMGGTQTGTGTQQTQYPPPSLPTQLAGLGIAGLGAFGQFGSGMGSMGWKPFGVATGGRIPGYQEGGETPLDPSYLDAIKGFEGYSARPIWDYRQWSSGYGTRASGPNDIVPREVHEERFRREIANAAGQVDAAYPDLPPGPRAALTSLTYNAGPGWMNHGLGAAVKAGDWQNASQLLQQYNRAGGKELPGLVSRRAAEAGWMTGAPQDTVGGEAAPIGGAAPPGQQTGQMAGSIVPPTPATTTPPPAPAAPTGGGGSQNWQALMQQGLKMAQPQMPQVAPIQFPAFRTPPVIGQSARGGRLDPSPDVPSPPLQPSEWPPFPLRRQEGGDVGGEPAGGPNPEFDEEFAPEKPANAFPVALGDQGAGQGANRTPGLPGPVGGLMGPPPPAPPTGSMAASPWMALMQAGLGMTAAAGQRDARGLPMSPLSAIGQGGLMGIHTLEQQREQARKDYETKLQQWKAGFAQRQAEMPYGRLTKAQELEALTPKPIGTDIWGKNIFGVRDLKTGRLLDPKTMKPIDPEALNPSDSSLRATAKKIASYELSPISPYAIGRNPASARIMEMVNEENPDYDAKFFSEANKARMAFGTGLQGDKVRSFSTMLSHLDLYEKLINALQQSGQGKIKALNALRNEWQTHFGTSEIPSEMNTAMGLLRGEVVNSVVGSRAALADREEAGKDFDKNLAPFIQKGQLGIIRDMAAQQLASLERQYVTSTHGARDFGDKLSPAAVEHLKRGREQQNKPATTTETKTEEKKGPQEGDKKQFKEGQATFKNGKWVLD